MHDEIGLVHCDLKPENILFQFSSYKEHRNPEKWPSQMIKSSDNLKPDEMIWLMPIDIDIKIIDLGNAMYREPMHNHLI